jgi:adenosine kinase
MNFSGSYKDLIRPDKLHVLSVSVLLDKLEETRGGIAANIAHNIALLGEEPVILASVGPNAKQYVKDLAAEGINTKHIHASKLPTASFTVMTDSDDNQVGGFYPGAMSASSSLTLKHWRGKDVVVCVSAHDPAGMKAQVAECQELGLSLVYDPGQQVSNSPAQDLKAGVGAAEVLIVNDYEFGVLTEKTELTPEAIKAKVPLVVTTLGKDGSVIEGAKVPQPIKIPIAKPAVLADPTGVGDAYRAGFLYGYLRQWQLPACGQLGAVVASFVIEHHGTQVQFSKQEIITRYQETFKEEITL